jgi:hypothetical protein
MYEQLHTHHQLQLVREHHEELRSTALAARASRTRGSLSGDGGAVRIRLRVRQRSRNALSALGITRTLGGARPAARSEAASRPVQ